MQHTLETRLAETERRIEAIEFRLDSDGPCIDCGEPGKLQSCLYLSNEKQPKVLTKDMRLCIDCHCSRCDAIQQQFHTE